MEKIHTTSVLFVVLCFVRIYPQSPRTGAYNRRAVAGRSHWNLTIAGFAADCAIWLQKYHCPPLSVIANHRVQSWVEQ